MANTNSLQFNGSNQYGSNPATTGLVYGGTAVTLEAWFKVNGLPAAQGVIFAIGDRAGPSTVVAQLQISSAGNLKGYIGAGNLDTFITGSTVLSLGTWYHGVVTYDGANINLYLGTLSKNDVSDASPVAKTGVINSPSLGHTGVFMGAGAITANVTFGDYFNGIADECRIWKQAQTLTDIHSLRESALTGAETNLMGLFRNNNGSGATSTDASSSGYDLTLGNNPTWATDVPFASYATSFMGGII